MKFSLLDFANNNWPQIVEIGTPILYEVLSRLIPTKNNISIIDNVFKIIRLLIPNKRLEKPTDKIVPPDSLKEICDDKPKRIIEVPADKHVVR